VSNTSSFSKLGKGKGKNKIEKSKVNDDRISLDYKMELKPGYSSFQLFPENPEKPAHVNTNQTKNHLLIKLLEQPREPKNFADLIKKFKGNFVNFREICKRSLV
jgi:hypothetical protein